jgi:hypothetical protein
VSYGRWVEYGTSELPLQVLGKKSKPPWILARESERRVTAMTEHTADNTGLVVVVDVEPAPAASGMGGSADAPAALAGEDGVVLLKGDAMRRGRSPLPAGLRSLQLLWRPGLSPRFRPRVLAGSAIGGPPASIARGWREGIKGLSLLAPETHLGRFIELLRRHGDSAGVAMRLPAAVMRLAPAAGQARSLASFNRALGHVPNVAGQA